MMYQTLLIAFCGLILSGCVERAVVVRSGPIYDPYPYAVSPGFVTTVPVIIRKHHHHHHRRHH